jgi:DNA helicase-2/ATP-dependent DNA helicase PcrA
MSLFSKLNSQQLSAVKAPAGIVRVIAGAGSGKTTLLTAKIAYEIQNGMNPSKIIALTFTKKAGAEMRVRLKKIIGDSAEKVQTGTFHSFAHSYLRKLFNYTLMSENDVYDVIEELAEKGGLSVKSDEIVSLISYSRNRQKPIEDLTLAQLAVAFKKYKLDKNLKDYDDLLEDFLLMLRQKVIKPNFDLVVVDEAQDNSVLQSEITKALIEPKRNLFIVGDHAQSIYAFRGANPDSFLEWSSMGCTDYPLSINYRSTQEVCRVANQVVKRMEGDAKVELVPIRQDPNAPKIVVARPENQGDESAWVMNKISELRREGHGWDSMAILYRSHYAAQQMQLRLTSQQVPFSIWSGQNLLTASHIQDVICFLRCYVNPKDSVAWTRVARLLPGIGKVKGGQIAEEIIRTGIQAVPNEAVTPIKQVFMYRRKDDFLKAVKNFYLPYIRQKHPEQPRDAAVERFLDYAASQEDIGKFVTDIMFSVDEKPTEGITLTTIHQSKGLEWENVFIIGVYDGLFPSLRNEEPGEELRLYYVAITRAKTRLFISFPKATAKGAPARNSFLDLVTNG